MAGYNFDRETLLNGVWIFAFGFVFILFSGLISLVASHTLKLKDATSNVYKMLSMFGNVIFMAYPVLNAIFKEEGIIYGIFFNLANDLVLWTIGVYLVNKHNTNNWKDNLKHLINGNTIAFGTGVIFILINLQQIVENNAQVKQVYDLLNSTFSPLGKTTIYLSMLFIGLILSEVKVNSFSDILKRYPLGVLALLKLLIVPGAAFILLYSIGDIISPMVKSIIMIQLAMPCGTIVSALASQYESDYKFATEGIFITTILSIITLPVIVHLTKIFG
jgi:malate permease and related proteins